MKEAFPLAWPAGQPRTRPQDQKTKAAWKLDVAVAQEQLVKELTRIDAITVLLSTNIPVGMRGKLISGTAVRDPGVAVYFTLKGKEDFSWMEVLGMSNPYPDIQEIEAAYKPLAIRWHPEAPTGDAETFNCWNCHAGRKYPDTHQQAMAQVGMLMVPEAEQKNRKK